MQAEDKFAMLLWICLSIYAFFLVVTFGHLYRTTKGSPRPKHFLFALIWPIWWIVAHGVTDSVFIAGYAARSFFRAFDPEGVIVFGLLVLAALFSGGWYLAKHWSHCVGTVDCGVVATKAAAVVAAFPFYWGWLLGS